MKDPTGMLGEPFLNLGVFVGSVVVGDGVDDLASGHDPFHAVEELDEFLMSMAGHAAANNVQRDKQDENPASIKMRTRGWRIVGRA